MKIAASSLQDGLNSQIDPRFGRCQYFIIVDPETMKFKVVSNAANTSSHGAGIQAAQIVKDQGVSTVITGNIGPNAFQALSAAGIRLITGASGTVQEVVEKYKKEELKTTDTPTVSGHFGIGGRRGQRQ